MRASGAGSPRKDRTHSLRWRIVLIVALLLTVTNVVVGVVTVVAFRGYLFGRLDDDLTTASQRALDAQSDLPSPPPDGRNPPPGVTGTDPDHDFIGAPGQSADTVVAVSRKGAFVIAGYTDATGEQHRLSTAAKAALARVPRDGDPVTRELGSLGAYRVLATRSDGAVFITALPVGGITAAIARLVLVIAIVAVLGVVVAAWAGAMLVRRAMRPLSRVAATASAVTALDLDSGDEGIPIRVSDEDIGVSREVRQVGTALNSLLGHVSEALAVRDRAETRVRAFVADASHELRTPLATIRAYAELTGSEPASPAVHRNTERIRAEAVRMGDLVEELLLLARLDSTVPPVREPVDLSALAVETTMDARAAGPEHRWALDLDDEPVVVIGDPVQLRRVVVNLLANARIHTPAGTHVAVSVHRDERDGAGARARLAVANDGPPISAASLPTLFDRFSRGDASRSRSTGTTGLGLSIVQAVALAHGGSVSVTSGPTRTEFVVSLPLDVAAS
ncbi:cell wall metabolism sensor histidine kinase WalK [Curtobacterium sp. MCBD17_019]|uniref:sensor histidine kinase n=1 Tax=Curtobacterium sp. MCBD17_019 TaxID=2175669 RepID=UPI000DAA4AA8|nr:HAMP domain-containing sensor histidine kinase [Curtobacterium sp. MCBD17_019]PZE76678.1 two-component sensor histidine kinase [Curtobacterium sp. MCBD17_019]